jgi:hypothetical protein
MKVVKNENLFKEEPKAAKTELETLKEEIKLLQNKLENQPQGLEERIKFFEAKQAHIKKLKTLDVFSDSIIKICEELEKEIQENGFFTENYFLKISKKQGYSNETELLKIQNPTVIGEVLNFALDKINLKRDEIKTLINA